MQDEKLKELAGKYRAGLCTADEFKQIRAWYDEFETNGYTLPPEDEIERASKDAAQWVIGQVKSQQQHHASVDASSRMTKVIEFRKNLGPFFRYAAAALLLVFIGAGVYHYLKPAKYPLVLAARKDVAPGSNRAVLTLGNGRRIILNYAGNGDLAQQGRTAVHKTGSGLVAYQVSPVTGSLLNKDAATDFNTITTPRGGQYQVILPDGTKAWLNSMSSIHFPVAFTGSERSVETTGEVYFEVAKDKLKPFTVSTGGQTVTVLGTHFNIMAYLDEPGMITTLLEGSVSIAKGGHSKVLKPGEQAVVNEDIKVVSADTEDAVAWKNGLVAFTDADLKSIMRKVSRWYDIDVEYQGKIADRTFTGAISRRSNLSALLKILALSHIQFVVNDKKLIVKQ